MTDRTSHVRTCHHLAWRLDAEARRLQFSYASEWKVFDRKGNSAHRCFRATAYIQESV